MADDEERREGSRRSGRRDPARNLRREAATIEGQAHEVGPETNTPSPLNAVPEPAADIAPEPSFPSPDPAQVTASADQDGERSGVASTHGSFAPPEDASSEAPAPGSSRSEFRPHRGTLAAIGFLVLAAGLLYLFYQVSSLPPDNRAAVSDLRGRLAAMEARPVPDAVGLSDRVAKVEGVLSPIRSGLDALGKRVDGLAATASSQSNIAGQVGDMHAELQALKADLASVKSSVAAIPRPDMSRFEARVGDMDLRLSGLQSALSGIPHVDLGPLTGKVDALETRLKPIEAETALARSPDEVAQRRAAPVAVTAQAIAEAIEAGQAFPKEVRALQALGTDPAKLAPLQAVAEGGAPSLRDLQASLAGLRDGIVAQGAAPASGSYMDRLVAGASSLVQVRPLGSAVGDTPTAIVSRMSDAIGNDDLATALAEWHKLPGPSQSASKSLVDRLKLRLDAEQAARDIAANAIGAMASPRG